MAGKKQEKSKQTEQFSTCSTQLLCNECGRTVNADSCCWEEDDEGRGYSARNAEQRKRAAAAAINL
jgi:hypothetical protein